MKKAKSLINLIAKAVGLAMGVAVTVLMILGEVNMYDAVLLLGIGTAALGICHFTNPESEKENK